MNTKHYTATLDNGSSAQFATITEARRWAEQHGTAANRCVIKNLKGMPSGLHVRDTGGNGSRWFKASFF